MKWKAKQLARAYVDLTDGKSEKDVEKIAMEFVHFLASRHELALWRAVTQSIDRVWRERYGAATITVTSAHPILEKSLAALKKAASGATIHEIVDPELIAGAKLRIDDRIIDGSAAGMLAKLKSALAAL